MTECTIVKQRGISLSKPLCGHKGVVDKSVLVPLPVFLLYKCIYVQMPTNSLTLRVWLFVVVGGVGAGTGVGDTAHTVARPYN